MSKQIQVNLAFNADTAKAKSQINDLVNSLNKISTKNSQILDDRQLREAATAAKDLTKHLEAAVNVNTGKLDLNKFSQSLSHSKQNLQDLYNSLSKAGPQGQQAFLQLASSIASSDSQVLNLNSKIRDLGQTLKNTVKWQLSSSLIHGFMGALQHAIGYAKDLNSSLNDIRIVTGASAEQMAKFAEQANKSAKALSSTTIEYTKASLIYYQQGLSNEEVKARTDITIKMANVSKESAQVVSDQMTAVWNNFYDGSKSLEYYADVMTALGAATASSVDEIAGGLEKFAAIGDTIGLSYEYAASALATITSNTRQSEEVVGTALKTIFARIQGLKLGETLEDGVDLNKYSAALKSVGISIFDSSGELKKMDNILDELGDKWDTMNKSQQVALAQTVAGTRQYTQLVALMDNWNKGDSDSFKSNLQTIANSEGALQEQQDIYAEGWEAAADRVTAAVEDIYDSLINDEAIVVLLNGLEKVLSLTGALIDGFGGLGGIILMVGASFAKSFAKNVPETLNKIKTNLKVVSGQAQKEKISNVKNAQRIIENSKFTGGNSIRAEATNEELKSLIALEEARDRLTESEYQYIRSKIAEKKASKEAIAVKQDELDQIKKEAEQRQKSNIKKAVKQGSQETPADRKLKLEEDKDILSTKKESLEAGRNKLLEKSKKGQLSIKQAEDLDSYNQELKLIEERNAELQKSIDLENKRQEIIKQNNLEQIDEDGNVIGIDKQKYQEEIQKRSSALQEIYQKEASQRLLYEDYDKQVNNWVSSAGSMELKGLNTEEKIKEVQKLKDSVKQYAEQLNKANNIDFTDKDLKKLNNELDKVTDNAEQVIQKFTEFASPDKIKEATKNIEETSDEVKKLKTDLEALAPDEFEKIDNEAREAAESIALTSHTLEQLKNNSNQIDVKIDVDSSQIASTLVEISSIAMDIGAIFTQISTIIKVWSDDSATATDKFIASLTGLGGIAMSSIQIFSTLSQPGFLKGLKDIGGALTGAAQSGGIFSKVLGGLGKGFTAAGASAGAAALAFGKVLLVIGAIIAIGWVLVKIFEKIKEKTPEGKLKAAKETTESMAESAREADEAYQGLLETISNYDSAIDTLKSMDSETQEFTATLIKANEEAWKLIETYGLIQGIDWDYGENGEIIINQSGKDKAISQENEKRQNAYIALNAAEYAKKEIEYDKVKNDQKYWISGELDGATSEETEKNYEKLYSAFGLGEEGKFKTIKEAINNAKTQEDYHKIMNDLGSRFYGSEWDPKNVDQTSFIQDAMEKVDSVEEMYTAYNNLKNVKQYHGEKAISTVLSDDKNYQQSQWKGAIKDTLEGKYDEYKTEFDNEYSTENKTDEDVQKEYFDHLKDQGYTVEGTKVYKEVDGKKEEVEGLSDLDSAGQRNVLSELKTSEKIKQEGSKMAQQYNSIFKQMNDQEKTYADAIFNNNLGALSKEQISDIKNNGLNLENIFGKNILSSLQKDPVLGNILNSWVEDAKEKASNWKMPEFNLDSWKKNTQEKMDIINGLTDGDKISEKDYNILKDQYGEYFDLQNDGTAILIGKAQELKDKANEIAIEEIKTGITEKKSKIKDLNQSQIFDDQQDSSITFSDAYDKVKKGELHESWEQGYIEAINETVGENFETVEQATVAYEEYISKDQEAAASAANSLNQLNQLREEGTITQEQYNEALNSTVIKDAEANDVKIEEVQDYAEYLEELIPELEDATGAAEKMALVEKKQSKGAEDLIDNYEDYAKILKEANLDSRIKTTDEYRKTIKELRKDISLLTGQEEEAFSDEFINSEAVQKELKGIAEGTDGATERLQALAALEVLPKEITAKLDEESYNTLIQQLAEVSQDTEIGVTIDDSEALSKLYDLMVESGMTANEIQSAFNKIGWVPKIDYETIDVADAEKYASDGYVEVVTGDMFSGYNVEKKQLSALNTIATNGKIRIPKVGNAEGGGKPTSFTKVNPAGNSSTKTSNKGGGGGGGSKKHAEKKSSSDRTRYHTLTNQLEDLKSEYEDISDAADKAFGQEKLDNIDAQIEKTDELIDKQEEYLDAISQNLPIDKNVMTAYYDDIIGGIAMQFDENGNISNYDAIEAAMHAKYNSMADRYTDDSEEWQVFEKKYEQLEKYIEQYEETYDLLRDEEAAYQELLNQRADLELEKVQYKIELELDVPENEIAKLEYQIGRIEDDAYESAEAVQLLTQQAEAIYDQIQVNKQGLNDVIKLAQSFNNGTLTEEQADLIKEYRDNLLDLNEQFDDIRATIEEKVMETFDSFNEKLQTSVDIFDHYNNVLESYKNIVDIVGEDRLGISDQFMNGLNQASIDNAIEQLKATDTAMKVIQNAQAQAETALAEAKARGDEASQRMWEETLSSLNEEAKSAQEEMLSAWENALDAIAETFEATVERVVKTFNDSIYALGGLEGLQEDFSRQQENADIMLDDYKKIYELSKLSRDINKTIDDTDIIGGKQKLKKLLGEINKLQEDGVEMSQYDLEYLQKTYDLRLAELELEEAQRAKNTVRLSRDNEGNWSYIYTQNTDAVDAAQQKYEDALYAMQDLSSNYIDEMSEQLISTSQEMAEALAAIRIQDYANINDYYAEVERVQSQYQEELAMQEEELQKAIDNNKVLYDTDWTNYHNATGYKISDTELFATTFRDTLLGALIGSEEDSANFTDIMKVAVSDLTNNLMAGAEIYYTNLENAMNAAGTSTGDFAEDTAANIDAVVEKSKEGAAAVDQMAIEMQTAMENIMDSVTNWQEAYGMAMENIIQSNLEVIESFNQMLAALSIDADSITVKYDIADAAGGQAQQFDTGGYTGEWGKGGKLAVLHEKELILKPEDTSNFLTAVQITRAMLETIDLNAKQASFGLGNLVPSTIRDDNNQTLEQQVHIVAEFPNVNDHNEIEQAFNNLINTASQYANRK